MLTRLEFILMLTGAVAASRQNLAVERRFNPVQLAAVSSTPERERQMNGKNTPRDTSRVLESSISGPYSLSNPSLRITLSPKREPHRQLSAELEEISADQRMYLVIKGVHANAEPGTLYHLYLDMPEHAPLKHRDVWHVGVLNFFGSVPRSRAGDTATEDSAWRSYDITAMLRNLNLRNLLTDPTTLTVVRSREVEAQSDPTVNSAEIVIQ
jgi:hypothetical protein